MPQRLPRPAWHPYIDKIHRISLTLLLLSFFFLLSYKPFTQAGPVMQLVMFDVSYIDCTPFKNKENYTADNQFKRIIKVYEINVWKVLN